MGKGQWEITGPYREGAFTIYGPNGEKIFLEIADEPRDSGRTKALAEKIVAACQEGESRD